MSRRSTVLASLTAVLCGLLVTLVGPPANATFEGKNGLILFNRAGNLFTATADGRSVKRVTKGGGISGAKWSPDGKRIAYKKGSRIVVRTRATGRSTTVAVGAYGPPSWSPDGSTVAFVAIVPDFGCEVQGIYTVPATGGAIPKLVYDAGYDNCSHGSDTFALGSYTADGGGVFLTICYSYTSAYCWMSEITLTPGTSHPPEREILRVSCHEDEEATVQPCAQPHISDARVGPHGNGLVFSGAGGYDPPTGTLPGSTPIVTSATRERIYAADKSGTNLHAVSTATSGYNPTWSPNGRIVLFTKKTRKASNIMKVVGTSPKAKATVLIKNASQADWQPAR